MVKHGSSIKLTMYGSFPVQSISVEIFTMLYVKFHKQAASRHCYYNWFVASAACYKYIANIIAVQLFSVLADQRWFLR